MVRGRVRGRGMRCCEAVRIKVRRRIGGPEEGGGGWEFGVRRRS